ncbi:Ral GTPase-activating protein subunit alpha-1 [Oopsacas minuta]|uniref:Ral GTPase-activating protein subunit alpha-1 n=1 Tax=Oopsacas minuta TaxID=111878 RepID=A0AAV7KI22_9METZ|nr:Ral GTPase-activating protein subunit alpha-1 [Oopsacas minuta]
MNRGRASSNIDRDIAIRKFLDTSKDSVKRLKALKQAYEKGFENEQDFYEQHYSLIFYVFYDAFLSFELHSNTRISRQRRSLESSISDKDDLFSSTIYFTFESILFMLPQKIHNRWQYHSIHGIILDLIHEDNSRLIRKRGIKLLVLWILCLQENTTDKVLETFGTLIPYFPPPFTPRHSSSASELSDTTTPLQPSPAPSPCDLKRGYSLQGSSRRVEWARHVPPTPICRDKGSSSDDIDLCTALELLDYFMNCLVNLVGYHRWEREGYHHRGLHYLFYQFKQHYLSPIFPEATCSKQLFPEWVNYHKNDSTFYRLPITSHSNFNLSPTPTPSIDSLNSTSSNLFKITYDLRNSVYAELQNAVIMKLLNWIDPEKLTHNTSAVFHSRDCFINGKESVLKILFTRPENIMLLHDMLHQTFKMPAKYVNTMQTVVRFFEFWTFSVLDEEDLPPFLRSPIPSTDSQLTCSVGSSDDSRHVYPNVTSVSQQPLLTAGNYDVNTSMSNLVIETTGARWQERSDTSPNILVTSSQEATPTSGASNRATAGIDPFLSEINEEIEFSTDLSFSFPPRPHIPQDGYQSYDMVWSIAYGAEQWDERNACLGIQKNLRLFICHTSRLLLLRQEVTNTHWTESSCKSVLKFYQALGKHSSPDDVTWQYLLNTLLEVVNSLYREEIFSETDEKRKILGDSLSELLHSTLLGLFIRMSQHIQIPSVLWDSLLYTYSNLTEQKPVVMQWSAMMKGLTYLLAYFVYDVDMINRPLKTHQDAMLKKPQSLRKRSGTGSNLVSLPRTELRPAHSSQGLESHSRDMPLALRPDKVTHPLLTSLSQEENRLLVSVNSTDPDFFDEPLHTVAYKGRTHPALDKVRRKRLTTSGTSSQSSHSPQSSATSTPQLPHNEVRGRAYSKESQESAEYTVARDHNRQNRPYSLGDMGAEDLMGYKEMMDTRSSLPPGQGGGGPLKRQSSITLRTSFRHQSLTNLLSHELGQDKTNRHKLESKFIKPIGEELRLLKSDYKFLLKMLFIPVLNLNYQLIGQGENVVLVHRGTVLEENITHESFIRENSDFPNVYLTWQKDTVAVVWRRMLGILNNPALIKTPKLLSIAFSCLAFIWQVFDDVTTIIIYSKRTKDIPYQHYPSPLHFSTWLCQGCLLQQEYKEGIKISYELLCKTHLSDKFPPPSHQHLDLFYSLLSYGYIHDDLDIVQACVKHSVTLFTRPYAGITALIPPCASAIRMLLQKSSKNYSQIETLTLLSNMLSVSRLYPGVGLREDASLESQLVEMLHYVAQNYPDTSSRILVIHQLTIFVFHSLYCNEHPYLVKSSLNDLLFFFQSQELSLYYAAVDMVDFLSMLYTQISQLDPSLPVIIIKSIALSLTTQLSRSLNRDQLTRYVIPLLHCLRSWLLAAPLTHLLKTDPLYPILLQDIITVLISIINDIPISDDIQEFFKEGVPDMQVTLSRLSSTSSGKTSISMVAPESYPQDHLNTEVQSVITTILYFIGHFPFGPGMSQISSDLNETMDMYITSEKNELDMYLFKSPCVQFYTYNDRTILSLVEVRADVTDLPCHIQTIHSHVRIHIRDAAGKFSWDVCTLHSAQSRFSKVAQFADILSVHSESTDTTSYQGSQEDLLSQREQQLQEETVVTEVPLTEDPVLSILKQLTQFSPEVLEERISLDLPTPPNRILYQGHGDEVESKMLRIIDQQNTQEIEYLQTYDTPSLQYPPMEEVSEFSESRHSFFKNCLSLLSQMGYFSWENRNKLHLMNKKVSLVNDLKTLDKMGRSKTNYTCRHHYKIGVIYIGPGQEKQLDILNNSSGSKEFNNFVESLGWEVETKSHKGYGGFMSDSQSKMLTYFADSTMEVVFHISTRILTSTQRGTDIKIQHIGNDDVVVFWSDHWHEYQRSQFRTDFMDIIIVIYPLSNGLYRIHINKRIEHKLLHFGPLHDGSLVRQECLAPLVRATAINALRAYRGKLISFHNVRCNERARKISRMIHEYKMSSTFEEFLAESLVPSGPGGQSQPNTHKSESSYTLVAHDSDETQRKDSNELLTPTKQFMRAKDSITGYSPHIEFLQQENKSVANCETSHKPLQKSKTVPQQMKGNSGNHNEHRF